MPSVETWHIEKDKWEGNLRALILDTKSRGSSEASHGQLWNYKQTFRAEFRARDCIQEAFTYGMFIVAKTAIKFHMRLNVLQNSVCIFAFMIHYIAINSCNKNYLQE